MKTARIKIEGVDGVLQGFNVSVAKINEGLGRGLMAGGLVIQAEAQNHVPVEHGTLRDSAYTRKISDRKVEVGFTDPVARFVNKTEKEHAGAPRPSGIGTEWSPEGEPHFLDKAVRKKRAEVADIIKAEIAEAIR